MVRLDDFIMGIRESSVLTENKFTLLSHGRSGEVVQTEFSGVYVIVDNGYLDWSCTVPPMTMTNVISEIRWSRWVESIRKDVECTFGILKGRWRILKSGIRLHGVLKVDDVWKTCCSLHNWLLDIDGLNNEWVNGVHVIVGSDWDGPMGRSDFEGVRVDIPYSIARLSTNLDPRNYDLSGMGPGVDVVGRINDFAARESEERVRQQLRSSISNMSLTEFRRRLIVHFDILFKENKIVWPKNN
jgi:hypothetical protein